MRRVNRDQISEVARLSSSKNFICKRKNFILNTLIDFELYQYRASYARAIKSCVCASASVL